MQPSNFNQLPPPPSPAPPAQPGPAARFRLGNVSRQQVIIGLLCLLLLVNLGISGWLFKRLDRYSALSAVGLKQTSSSSSTFNGDDTLFIDTKNKAVGVGDSSPEGLQVDSSITPVARGTANIRLGLLNGQPALIFEDQKKQQTQLGISNGTLQLSSGAAVYATISGSGYNINNNLSVQGNTTLGKSASNTTTFQSNSLAIPNNLNIGGSALYISSGKGVAIGTNNTLGYRLYVSGNSYNTGSLQTGGQVIVPAKNAATPSISFAGNGNTGLFSPGSNMVSLSAGGKETLRVAPGNVSTLNSSNLDVAGYLQAGSGGPSWKIARYTGTLDGSGTGRIAHGISNAPKKVLLAMGWYESSTGQAKFLSVDYIDGSYLQVSGGVPGSAWRGVILYTSDTAGW